MGGALVMNAGAHGGETWSIVRSVRVIDRAGRMHTRAAADFTIGYRQACGRTDEWFVATTLCLVPADPEQCLTRIREHLARRAAAQPIGKPSCGSVFRNPPGDHAGRLIEAAGLKGAREGGCHVSTLHANFIINDGGASARDVERLMRRIQNAVRETTGVELQPEVRIVGDPEPAAANETNRESDDGR
jgi:UDP-N-acetylmuramate dehydrogenase